ncbi:MAG: hypothetical protein KKA62_03780 [Nanoarchaeota archaeon]|nr:hypothetical protein [Nanoarchaeota archaeon]MBU1644153.1 hypothetical protein [Nanoarchaeota archaeon]MBU1977045.1 hypothetical protein [Nanoarchaeota archaeon]
MPSDKPSPELAYSTDLDDPSRKKLLLMEEEHYLLKREGYAYGFLTVPYVFLADLFLKIPDENICLNLTYLSSALALFCLVGSNYFFYRAFKSSKKISELEKKLIISEAEKQTDKRLDK